MRNLIYQRDASVGVGRIPIARVPPTTQPSSTTAASTQAPVTVVGGHGGGAVQVNSDGTVKGVSALPVDPTAPTKIDQSIIEDFSKLLAVVTMLGGSQQEANALWTTPGTWSNVDLSTEEASSAKLEGLTPTEYAIRKGLRALRDAVVNGGSDPGNATIIVKPPAPVVKQPPQPLPGSGQGAINVNVSGQSNMSTAMLAIGGGLAVYLISKLG